MTLPLACLALPFLLASWSLVVSPSCSSPSPHPSTHYPMINFPPTVAILSPSHQLSRLEVMSSLTKDPLRTTPSKPSPRALMVIRAGRPSLLRLRARSSERLLPLTPPLVTVVPPTRRRTRSTDVDGYGTTLLFGFLISNAHSSHTTVGRDAINYLVDGQSGSSRHSLTRRSSR